ncbi:hypothetical protein SDC9_104544 [bioreactor metagenome]|uniref:Uncharacterized protein n=1 Tax=bioreactor metagenome TaxID=1076179 RepID=A0A645AZJ2_9ZZZZ
MEVATRHVKADVSLASQSQQQIIQSPQLMQCLFVLLTLFRDEVLFDCGIDRVDVPGVYVDVVQKRVLDEL